MVSDPPPPPPLVVLSGAVVNSLTLFCSSCVSFICTWSQELKTIFPPSFFSRSSGDSRFMNLIFIVMLCRKSFCRLRPFSASCLFRMSSLAFCRSASSCSEKWSPSLWSCEPPDEGSHGNHSCHSRLPSANTNVIHTLPSANPHPLPSANPHPLPSANLFPSLQLTLTPSLQLTCSPPFS